MFLSNRGSFRPETSGAYTLRRRGRRRPKSGSAIGACAVARLAGSGGPIGDYYGSANIADPDLRDLLHYVATGRPDGALSREIDSLVEEYNRDREWVTKVLTYEQDTEMRCRRAEAKGIEQGIEQGMDRLGTLVGLLLDAGRLDDARRVSEDAAYRDEMLAEFGLKVSE